MKKIFIIAIVLLSGCKTTHIDQPHIGTSLLGVVYDRRNNPVQNAVISITNSEREVVVTTDIDGRFFIPELEFSTYRAVISGAKTMELTVNFDHFDIENTLILRVSSFEDLIVSLEDNLREKTPKNCDNIIQALEAIDENDIYLLYLKSIYLIKRNNIRDARTILESINDGHYRWIDALLMDLEKKES